LDWASGAGRQSLDVVSVTENAKIRTVKLSAIILQYYFRGPEVAEHALDLRNGVRGRQRAEGRTSRPFTVGINDEKVVDAFEREYVS
jgi:hypothetical protein